MPALLDLLLALHESPPATKLLLKATVLLSYLAWVGELRLGKCGGQWRAYLRRLYYLLAVVLSWLLLEFLLAHLRSQHAPSYCYGVGRSSACGLEQLLSATPVAPVSGPPKPVIKT